MGGDRALLLIHGLGATGRVWDGWRPLLPAGFLAPDLPGHGSADPLDEYTFAAMTAGLAATLDDSASYVVIGHSLGGVIGWSWRADGTGSRWRPSSGSGSRWPGPRPNWTRLGHWRPGR